MLFARRRKRVPKSVRSMEMKVGSETSRGGLPVRLAISFSHRGELDEAVLSLPIQSVDRRTEAMDLLFRIAGHSRYRFCAAIAAARALSARRTTTPLTGQATN
jgi:hypothetical protein